MFTLALLAGGSIVKKVTREKRFVGRHGKKRNIVNDIVAISQVIKRASMEEEAQSLRNFHRLPQRSLYPPSPVQLGQILVHLIDAHLRPSRGEVSEGSVAS